MGMDDWRLRARRHLSHTHMLVRRLRSSAEAKLTGGYTGARRRQSFVGLQKRQSAYIVGAWRRGLPSPHPPSPSLYMYIINPRPDDGVSRGGSQCLNSRPLSLFMSKLESGGKRDGSTNAGLTGYGPKDM